MKSKNILYSFIIGFLIVCPSCNKDNLTKKEVKLEKLTAFKTIISADENLAGLPNIIKYDADSTLYVYDQSKRSVLRIKNGNKIVQTYGRSGRGPGEILRANTIFLTDDYLYIVDRNQYYIHKYQKKGNFVNSLDYGKLMNLGRQIIPPSPYSAGALKAKDINNQPFVDQQGNVLLSSIKFSKEKSTIYKLYGWTGNFISGIGAIPPGADFITDADKIREAAVNHKVPALFRLNAFAVRNLADANSYYLVYSSIPKIAKYSSDGKKIWEKNIEGLTGIDRITRHFIEDMKKRRKSYIALDYYAAGTGSPDGGMFLITAITPISGINDFYIHHFNSEGKLMHRYKLIAEAVPLLPIFDVDFKNKRIFIVTERGEIRAYKY